MHHVFPDGVADVRLRTSDGRTHALRVTGNVVAFRTRPRTHPERLTWRAPDGSRRSARYPGFR